MPLDDQHTAANTAEELKKSHRQIQHSTCQGQRCDNGANVVAAAKILKEKRGWASMQCAGHILNVVVHGSLKGHQVISVSAARCLGDDFKDGELACKLQKKSGNTTADADSGC